MQLFMLKSKIHGATVTGAELYYEGSIAIDQDLMDQADILPGEQVQVLNMSNGERLVTYTITAPRGSGTIEVNGPAARMCAVGDRVIIIAYCQLDEETARQRQPIIMLMGDNNRPVKAN